MSRLRRSKIIIRVCHTGYHNVTATPFFHSPPFSMATRMSRLRRFSIPSLLQRIPECHAYGILKKQWFCAPKLFGILNLRKIERQIPILAHFFAPNLAYAQPAHLRSKPSAAPLQPHFPHDACAIRPVPDGKRRWRPRCLE